MNRSQRCLAALLPAFFAGALQSSAQGNANSGGSAATSVASAKDPAACLGYARGEWQRLYDATTKRKIKWTDSLDKKANAAVARLARECLIRFPLANAEPGMLRTMLDLYFSAALRDSIYVPARMYVRQATTDSDRAEALLYAVMATRPWSTDSSTVVRHAAEETEKFAAELDSLGPRFTDQQVSAHRTLASVYTYAVDDPAKRFAHLSRARNLLETFSPEARRKRPTRLSETYAELADYYSAQGDVAQAKAMIAQALRDSANLDERSRDELRQAALIGGAAPPLVASNWLNMPPGTAELEPKGHVTLVMLTAHW